MSTEIIVGCMALGGVLGSATIAAVTQVWLKQHVGKSNGEGSLVEMVSSVLREQVRQGDRVELLSTQLGNHIANEKVHVRG